MHAVSSAAHAAPIHARWLAAAIGTSLLMSACGGGPPKARVEDQQQQRDFASRGYVGAAESVAVQTLPLRLRNDFYRLSLTSGGGSAARPVVLYLPGLGESEHAGHAWRNAWAAAGYAVLAVQPLEDDATAWGSELARAAEFTQLGRRHFAEAELRRRVARLDELLGEVQRLGRAGEAPWRSLDWSRAALAGFDLGAQTAMTIAGESLSDGTRLSLTSWTPRAVIVISPQVMSAPQPAHYQSIAMPVLGITGDHDDDLLGLVPQTRWRSAPFDAVPADRSWLLRVDAVRHAPLSGTEGPPTPEKTEGQQRRSSGESGGGGGGRRRGGGGGMGGMGGGPQGVPGRMAPVPDVPDYRGLHQQQLALIAARQVSVAFLDLQLKQSAQARDWLAGPANVWMGQSGRLSAAALR
ncbi:alpha/beta hydrolase family protein [Roseateles amylovorans]|uniref:Alpha/beta hydrolase n=1 Tax=Roseateles amylovorans TaxID=2978473 RepID=A0ABY6AVB5_9BURK|nr:hypothetical protein [Roseateles amylovorans]UXH76735.1 hypothetical protein N4261_17055 [Roseateles amylovorans]